MSLGDDVIKLENENKALREIVNDIELIDEALKQLTQVVADVLKKLSDIDDGSIFEPGLEVIESDETGQAKPGPQNTRYTVTEVGGDDEMPQATYKVDTSQYLPGDF